MNKEEKERKFIKKLYLEIFGIPLITILVLLLIGTIIPDEEEPFTWLDFILSGLFISAIWFSISSIIIYIIKIIRRKFFNKEENNETETVNYEEEKTNENEEVKTYKYKISLKGIITASLLTISLITIIVTLVLFIKNNVLNNNLEPELKFEYIEKYVKENNCELIKDEENYTAVNNNYYTDSNCPIKINYIDFINEEEADVYFYRISKELRGVTFEYSYDYLLYSVKGYSTTSDLYQEAIKFNNIVAYFEGDISYKDEINNLIIKTGFRPENTIIFILGISIIVFAIMFIITICNFYVKIGSKGWKAIIPIYNIIELSNKAMDIWAYALLPIMGIFFIKESYISIILEIIFYIIIFNKVGKKFNKNIPYRIGLILLPTIFIPLLIFEKKVLVGDNYEK